MHTCSLCYACCLFLHGNFIRPACLRVTNEVVPSAGGNEILLETKQGEVHEHLGLLHNGGCVTLMVTVPTCSITVLH